jgi:hypothetical protein
LKNEEEVSGINSGLADFLVGLSVEVENPVFVCVNVRERMRGTQPICGRLWTQEDRQMTATNPPMEKLDKYRESVTLSGIVDALTWRHVIEVSVVTPHAPFRVAGSATPTGE